MGQLQSDNTRVKEQGELEAPRCGNGRDPFVSESETNRKLGENIRELRAQYDQEVAGLL